MPQRTCRNSFIINRILPSRVRNRGVLFDARESHPKRLFDVRCHFDWFCLPQETIDQGRQLGKIMSADRSKCPDCAGVPYLDLDSHHAPRRAEFLEAIGRVIDSGAFAGGREVDQFEENFASYCQSRFAIGVGSGTEALALALAAFGIGAGDEVITVPMTFIATAEAISSVGAKPVFVDIDEKTFTLDPKGLENALTPATKAIIPVHLFGQCADMDPINAFAREHRLTVIEDAAQAHGARYNGALAGSLGDAGCFSFYPGKNLGAFGEAGAVTTDREDISERIRMLRDHGQAKKYYHDEIGCNGRMDGIQAAVLAIKLRKLDEGNRLRRNCAALYDESLSGIESLTLPVSGRPDEHARHIYPIRVGDRNKIISAFKKAGVGFGIHYPVPVHLQKAYAHLGYQVGDFPVSERCAEEFFSLPMYPELARDQIESVVETLGLALS